MARPAVAIAHDYLTQRGGAERVVLALARAFPHARIHTSFYDPAGTFPEFAKLDVVPLPIDRISGLRRRHRLGLPVLPLAFGSAKVDADVVLCSSSGWAHGIRTDGVKLVYCHSPAKWLYRREDYLGLRPAPGARVALDVLTPALRAFDRRAAASAAGYLANSTFIAKQIADVYGIDAKVVWPPGGLPEDGTSAPVAGLEPGFFLTVARLLPYKNVGPTAEAFRGRDDRLVVVGSGPQRAHLTVTAPPNVTFLGEVDDAALRWLYGACAGLVASSREDFGLTPVEAASFGKPTAALAWGGFLDTVDPAVNGVLFDAPEPEAIAEALDELAARTWDAGAIRAHAARFSENRFATELQELVERAQSAGGRPW
jgi:glycosyltransferase involved in cell wall biosynthesis